MIPHCFTNANAVPLSTCKIGFGAEITRIFPLSKSGLAECAPLDKKVVDLILSQGCPWTLSKLGIFFLVLNIRKKSMVSV